MQPTSLNDLLDTSRCFCSSAPAEQPYSGRSSEEGRLTYNACYCSSAKPQHGRHLAISTLLYQLMGYAPAHMRGDFLQPDMGDSKEELGHCVKNWNDSLSSAYETCNVKSPWFPSELFTLSPIMDSLKNGPHPCCSKWSQGTLKITYRMMKNRLCMLVRLLLLTC